MTRRGALGAIGIVVLAAVVVSAAGLLARDDEAPRSKLRGASADRGRDALVAYGCGSCHTIPGVRGANARVGPSLADWSQRSYVAGRLPNRPAELTLWIRHPQRVEPGSAMPELGVSPRAARDIAQYLYRLR